MREQEREHVTDGTACWCKPFVLSYGAALIFDEDGTLVDRRRGRRPRGRQAGDGVDTSDGRSER